MVENDRRFTYHDRPLERWLQDLVADHGRRRNEAAATLQAIRLRPPEGLRAPPDPHAHLEAFDAAVRSAVRAPGFDGPGFLSALIGLLRASERKPGNADPQERFAQSLAASFVFLALRDEILWVPEEIRVMLRDPRQRWNALQVIERLGPQAGMFADDLIAQLDAAQRRRPFDAPDALAAVIRDDAARVGQIVERLEAAEPAVAEGAAETLYSLGPRAAELFPASDARLTAAGRREGWPARASAVAALGRVTQGADAAVDTLLDLSRSSDPATRGAALTALGEVGRQPEKVVPRLVEAFDDYRETDPDWLSYSQHERVVRALQAFGPAAVTAVSSLAARLRRREHEFDRGVIETLGRLGPAAREALPVLEEAAEEAEYTEEDFAAPADLDEDDDFLAIAILRIRGAFS